MTKKELLKISDFESLLDFLVDELDWPLDIDNLGEKELTFSYSADEIGLSDEMVAKVNSIKQLRPFIPNQPWAIFWMDFEAKKLPVSVLRRILRHFVIKKRAADPSRATWQMEDIMFVSGHGDEETRGVTFAHFKSLDGKEVMREFSWDNRETHFDNYISYLEQLKWSDEFESSPQVWSESWRAAFRGSTREAVKTSKQLAISMAWIAQDIRDRVKEVYEIERENGALHKLYDSFKEGLIHDMTVDQFADMYAQTMTYGLFSARTMDADGHFEMNEVAELIPATNPFLKKLFKECLDVGTDHNEIDLDELGVGKLVDLLDSLNKSDGTDVMIRILEEFGRQTGSGNEDPVIHFYEEFLKEYDHIQRVDRGVYYTPDPVVDFIVRSVNEQLKSEFGLEMGLADTTTWDQMVATGRAEWPKDPKTGKTNQALKDKLSKRAFVQILDPATGTGTFLIRTITEIHKEVEAKYKRENIQTSWLEYWNNYVEKELFPRLYGFELMMASYSVAHMRIGMHLKSLKYKFRKGQRLNVYLTNTLESPDEMGSGDLFFSSIGTESEAAKLVKRDRLFSVVIGNPPYSGISSNNGEWIKNLIEDYKYVDGVHFRERKHWLNDDYVKFLRYGEYHIEKNGSGILAYINPHGFLDNPTFRGMRWHLMQTYNNLFTLDLHGNSKKKEISPDGSSDINVFDIQQGVSINVFVKRETKIDQVSVLHSDMFGSREAKYELLFSKIIKSIDFVELTPDNPFYFFIQKSRDGLEDYKSGIGIDELFPINVTGVVTARDSVVIDISEQNLISRIEKFTNSEFADREIRNWLFPNKNDGKYLAGDSRGWKLENARRSIANNIHKDFIKNIDYRPFDTRRIYYSPEMVDWGREKYMYNIIEGENFNLITARQSTDENWSLVQVTKNMIDNRFHFSYKGIPSQFPIYLYPEANGQKNIDQVDLRKPNLKIAIVKQVVKKLGLEFSNEKEDTKNTFAPIDILDYIYGILHSPTYRKKYKEFLKIDFPRVPYPDDKDTFWQLVHLGGQLREIHLLESDVVNQFITEFPESGSNEVTKSMTAKSPGWIADEDDPEFGDVLINDEQYFSGVPKIAWEFYIGGYQPAQKWLKDRKGRVLSEEDINHYQKIIVALTETDRIMKEIDKIDIV